MHLSSRCESSSTLIHATGIFYPKLKTTKFTKAIQDVDDCFSISKTLNSFAETFVFIFKKKKQVNANDTSKVKKKKHTAILLILIALVLILDPEVYITKQDYVRLCDCSQED